MENLFGIGILLDYQDRASANMLKTQRIFSQTQQTAEQLAEAVEKNNEIFKKLAGISAGVAIKGVGLQMSGNKILGVLREAIEESKTFELELVELGIILGATSEEMALLEKKALETGMATMFSPQEAVQGMKALAAAGMDLDQVLVSLNHALDLVAVSGGAISLEEGAGLLASTLNKFNLDVSEAERVSDMFAHISNLTSFGVEDMPAFINALGTAPTKIGRSLEEMLAMGGLLSNIGQLPAQAGATVQGFGRQLIMITQQLQRGKGTKVDVLKELGLDEKSFWDAEGNMLSMIEIFQNITKATAGLTDMERATALQRLFGDQAGNMINAVEGASRAFLVFDEATGKYIETSAEGKTTFEDVVKGLSDIGGTARASAKMMEETFWGVVKLKEGVEQTFRVLLGQTVMPILGEFYQGLSGVLEKIVNFGYEHPKFMKALGYGLGLAGLLLTAVGMALILAGAIGGVISGIGILTGKIATLATTWLGLNASMISGSSIANALWLKMRPLATQAGALALTLGALYLAWKSDFGGIKTIITDFIDNTRHAFTEARQIIGLNTDEMLTALRKLEQEDDFFSKLTVGLVKLDTLWKGLTEAWSDYTLSEETFVKLRELGLLPLIEKILDAKMKFEAFFEGIKIGFGTVSEVVQRVVTTIGEWIDTAKEFIRDLISPTREVKDEVEEVNDVVGGIDTEGWKNFGKAVGIVGGLLLTYKIASMVWGIVTALGSFGKTLMTETIPNIWKFVAAMGAKMKAMLIDKAETLYLMGLYAKEGIAKGLLTAKTWLLTGATNALAVAQGAVNALFVASPIGWIILAIVALVGVIYLLIKNWDKVKEAVLGFVERSIEWLKGLWEEIKTIFAPIVEFFSGLWNGIKEFAIEVWNNFLTELGIIYEGVMAVWTPIKEWFSELWTGIKETASTIWGGILEFIEGVVDGVKTAWDTVTDFFSGIWDGIKETAKVFFDWIEEKFGWVSDIADKVTGVFSGIADGVKSGVGKVVDGAKKLVGFSTGGYVKEQGIAVLHPNEVVVNDKITEMLKTFLLRNKEGEISQPVVVNNIQAPEPQVISQVTVPQREQIAPTTVSNYSSQDDNSVVFEKGAIQIIVEKGTEEDAERFAEMIMKKIEKKKELRRTMNYGMQPV